MYVEVANGRIWYDVRGVGEPLVLLHGGAVDARFFSPNIKELAGRFRVFTPDLRGHGHTPDVDGPFTYDALAADIIELLEAVITTPAHVAGHSIGAGVALHIAVKRPDLVRRLVLISGAFHYDGFASAGTGSVDDADVEEVVAHYGPAYAEVSPDGEEHYPVVVRKGLEMDLREPVLTVVDLAGVRAPTLVMTSDDDLVTLEHSIALYRGIGNAEFAIVPGTSHFLTKEKPALCN